MGVSDDVVVRPFRAEDLPQVREIFKAGMQSYAAFQAMPEHTEEYLRESLSSDLSDIEGTYIVPGGNFWVATPKTAPAQVVGMVGLEPKDNKEGELRRMSVKYTHRRLGVGGKLIAALEQWAQENGFRKVWLTTVGVMDKARAFYPSMGYVQTAITVMSEDPLFEIYTFEKHLSASATEDIAIRPFRAEDMEQVVREGMLHYPAHKTNAEVLEQQMTEAVTTGDLSCIEATSIAPGGNFSVAMARSEPTEIVGMVALEAQANTVGELRRMSVKESRRHHGVLAP
ncbi:N-acetyltransferase-like protein [Phytophthora cinnamomi]|uniref:N-acetyltransferase-like protein n=1 Tax=Phytophthora cinnamomi TaxID=4785 RepID=UPI00355A6038|nr:N-acetyltransferase-like protein [Phytophthora cinnamomi]